MSSEYNYQYVEGLEEENTKLQSRIILLEHELGYIKSELEQVKKDKDMWYGCAANLERALRS